VAAVTGTLPAAREGHNRPVVYSPPSRNQPFPHTGTIGTHGRTFELLTASVGLKGIFETAVVTVWLNMTVLTPLKRPNIESGFRLSITRPVW
jgi:hypothetical protein